MLGLEYEYIFRESPIGPVKLLDSFAHWDFYSDSLLYVGELECGSKVIVILINENEEYNKYNMVKVTDEDLIKILKFEIDLTDVFLKPGEVYSCAFNLDREKIFFTYLTKDELDVEKISNSYVSIKEFYKTFSDVYEDEVKCLIKKLEGDKNAVRGF